MLFDSKKFNQNLEKKIVKINDLFYFLEDMSNQSGSIKLENYIKHPVENEQQFLERLDAMLHLQITMLELRILCYYIDIHKLTITSSFTNEKLFVFNKVNKLYFSITDTDFSVRADKVEGVDGREFGKFFLMISSVDFSKSPSSVIKIFYKYRLITLDKRIDLLLDHLNWAKNELVAYIKLNLPGSAPLYLYKAWTSVNEEEAPFVEKKKEVSISNSSTSLNAIFWRMVCFLFGWMLTLFNHARDAFASLPVISNLFTPCAAPQPGHVVKVTEVATKETSDLELNGLANIFDW
jgi:hypothetical protein